MKKIIILVTCILLYQFTNAQAVSNTKGVPRTFTLPGIFDPAFPHAQAKDVGLTKKSLGELGDEVTSWVANGELIGGELLIIKDGKTILHEAYGWSDREENRPLKRNSIWSIKSMSKPFTATAIMMLSEQGKLTVSDKLTAYIPEYAGDPRTTIANLLSHTSGYSGLGNTLAYQDIGSWVRHMAASSPTEEYGTYNYADFNFAVLGYIVELVSEMPVEEYLQINILNPLMLNESFTNFSPDSSWASNVNSRYRMIGNRYEKYWSNTNSQGWQFYPAAWGIWGTALDYSKFLTMFLNKGSFNDKKILTEHTVQDMISPHGNIGGAIDYGYGWFLKTSETDSSTPIWFGHGGFDGTIAFAIPEDNLIVIFMTHSRGTNTRNALMDCLPMLGVVNTSPDDEMVRGDSFTKPVLKLTATKAESYAGYYRTTHPNDPNEELLIRVEIKDNHLRSRMNSFGMVTGSIRDLIYLGEDRFLPGRYDDGKIAWINPDMEYSFQRKKSAVVSIKIKDGQTNISAEKVNEEQVEQELIALKNITYIDDLVAKAIDDNGTETARELSRKLHITRPDSIQFGESFLNSLGYRYLDRNQYENALAVFEMNVDAHKDQPNCYDSLADAWKRKGNLKKAMENYQKAVNLAREQGDPRLPNMESRLNAIVDQMKEYGTD